MLPFTRIHASFILALTCSLSLSLTTSTGLTQEGTEDSEATHMLLPPPLVSRAPNTHSQYTEISTTSLYIRGHDMRYVSYFRELENEEEETLKRNKHKPLPTPTTPVHLNHSLRCLDALRYPPFKTATENNNKNSGNGRLHQKSCMIRVTSATGKLKVCVLVVADARGRV